MMGTVNDSLDGPRFGLWYHLQNPARWYQPPERVYEASVDQAAWAERMGFDSIWASEHHFHDDGYTPSPLLFLAAVASRTSSVRLATNLLVASLHHPLRLAEDSASLAILSGGRFDLGIGAGYQQHEFTAFGRKLEQRAQLIEESTHILRRAWAGRTVGIEGRVFSLPDVRVAPTPSRPPRLLMGGRAQAAINRAARLADGYLPAGRPGDGYDIYERYLGAVQRAGGDRATATIMRGMSAIIAEDPERVLATVGEHVVHQVNGYVARGTFGDVAPFERAEDVVRAGYVRLWDAALAVKEITSLLDAYPQIRDIHWWAQFAGEPVESGSERVEYIADKVLPALRGLHRPIRAH